MNSMFYENCLEQEPELIFENSQDQEPEDEYRQDRFEEMANRFGGY